MRYVDFRDSILRILRQTPAGLTWRQLRDQLSLPYKSPCPEWVRRMEQERGLVRSPGVTGAVKPRDSGEKRS